MRGGFGEVGFPKQRKAMLFEESLNTEAHEERKHWLSRVFKWLAASEPEEYPGVFEFWGQPLGDMEKAMLVKWRNSA